jgi:drug/metabolite transporter (DMT)-like permease
MGYLLALLTAVLVAISDVLCRALFRSASWLGEREMVALRLVLAAPLLLTLIPTTGVVQQSRQLLPLVVIGIPLEVLALLAYMRAIRTAQLSLVLPMLALTPALLLITGPLVAGESWSVAGVPGVIVVVAGLWLVGSGEAGGRWFAPIAALTTTPASRAMLVTACCYSVTAAIGKRGAVAAGPLAMAVWYYLGLTTAFAVVAWPVRSRVVRAVREHPRLAVGIGTAYTLHLLTHMVGISLIPAAEMIACKRLSVLLAPLLARFVLAEALPRRRLLAITLMVAGATWIVLVGRSPVFGDLPL